MGREVDMFLYLDGVEGESADTSYKEYMELLGWGWGLSNTGSFHTATGGGTGKGVCYDISVTKLVDKATPLLALACMSGQHISHGTLVCRRAGGKQVPYLTITVQNVLVSRYQTGGKSESPSQSETFSLNFAQYIMEYYPQSAQGSSSGSVDGGWNIPANTKV
jgi:type VI secretion system secreted protein Hcp